MKLHPDKDIAEALAACIRAGWRVRDGARHIKVYPPAGPMLVISGTPSDHRAKRNILADLKRAARLTAIAVQLKEVGQ